MLPINQNLDFVQDPQNQSFKEYLIRLYIQTPLSTKFILKLAIALFLVQRLVLFFNVDFISLFATSPEQTFGSYKLYTILISPMISTRYLSIIINCYFFYQQSYSVERAKGSLSFLLDFFVKCILIQLVFLFIASVITPILISDKIDPKIYGLFPFCIYLLSLKVLKDGDKPCMILFTPFQIRQKFYLLLMLILSYFFTRQVSDSFSAVIVATLQYFVLRKDLLGFLVPTLEHTNFIYAIRQNLTGYISYDQREEILQMLNEENKLDIQNTMSRYEDYHEDVLINNFSQNSKPNSNNNSSETNNSSGNQDQQLNNHSHSQNITL